MRPRGWLDPLKDKKPKKKKKIKKNVLLMDLMVPQLVEPVKDVIGLNPLKFFLHRLFIIS